MDWRVPLADLDYGVEEESAVLNVLRSKWLTMGEVTQAFESEFAQLTGAQFAFTVSNATEALHLACLALGIGPGDEVITPSLTFVATSNAVLYTGADVRFAEVCGADDLTIDPADIERKITLRTRAISVMHYGGYPCRMPEILAVAEKHGLPVIEDAAHSPGVKAGVAWYGRLTGDKTALTQRHPVDLVADLKAPVLGLYGAKDTGIPMASVEEMKAALAKGSPAARESSFQVYPEAGHAFHADYRPSYLKPAADDGWQRCLEWFKKAGVA